jgi:hypothetical protein
MTLEEKNAILLKYGLGKGASLKDTFYTREKHYYYFHYFRKIAVDHTKGLYDKEKALGLLSMLKDVYEADYAEGAQGLVSHEQFEYEYQETLKDIERGV